MNKIIANYQLKKLSDLTIVFADGDWIESRDQSLKGIRLIQTGNVGIGVFKYRTEKARYISEDTFNRLNCTEIFENDCLVSRLPEPVGRSCLVPNLDQKLITAVDCTIIRFNKNINPKFYIYYTQSHDYQNQIENKCSGSTRKRISRKNLGEIQIPLPPLSTQQKIVAELDQASAQITASKSVIQSQLNALEQLWQSGLSEVFENDENKVKIGELCHIKHGYAFSGKQFADKGDFLLLTPGNFSKENGLIIRENKEKFYLGEFSQEYLLKKGDLLIAMTDLSSSAPILGAPGIITQDNMLHNQRLGLIQKLSNEIDKNYLYYFFHSNFYRQRIRSTATGTTVRHTSPNRIYEIKIPLPPLSTQTQIVAQLDNLNHNISSLKSQYKAQLKHFDDLRASILDQAFKGELVK